MVAKYASLSSDSRAVRGKLQAALYYDRKKNRNLRISADAPLSLSGALVGVIGSGGALPTGWVKFSDALIYEVVSLDKISDIPAITIKISGTNSSGATAFVGIKIEELTGVAEGEEYTLSAVAQILDETIPFAEANPRISLQSRLNDAYVNGDGQDFPVIQDNVEVVHIIAATANELWAVVIDNSVLNTVSCDVTIQIAMIRIRRTG